MSQAASAPPSNNTTDEWDNQGRQKWHGFYTLFLPFKNTESLQGVSVLPTLSCVTPHKTSFHPHIFTEIDVVQGNLNDPKATAFFPSHITYFFLSLLVFEPC